MSESLDPVIKDQLKELQKAGTPDYADLSVGGARRLNERLLSVEESERDPVDRIRDLEISGPDSPIPIRVYEPDTTGPRPVFVYFHGGGWVCGTSDSHDHLCRAIATAGECTVVSVDYRLAPEYPFPAALQDCYAATEWVHVHSDIIGADADRLVIGGSSSGGNLAAGVALRARDMDGPPVTHQFLICPPLDHSFTTTSYEEYAEGYLLTQRGMKWFWAHYLERPLDGKHPYASPLQARDLSSLPPATVVTAGFDPLRDEGVTYAERLSKAGVPVEHRSYRGMIHGFVSMLSNPELDAARNEIALIGETIGTI